MNKSKISQTFKKIIASAKQKKSESKLVNFTSNAFLLLCVSAVATVIVLKTPIGSKAIRSYIMNNPRDIIQSLQEMDKQEKEKNEIEAKAAAHEVSAEIINDKSTPFLGNKDGTNTVIIFFDYSCTYCKRAGEEIKEVLKQRKDVKVLLQDFPILSMNSLLAAKAGLYVAKNYPAKFEKFHFALLAKQSLDENAIKDVASSFDISRSEMKKAMESSEFEAHVREVYTRATKIKANGTPVFIINGKLTVGAISAQSILAELGQ